MKNIIILDKAIQKAKENGYVGRPFNYETIEDVLYDCSITDIIFLHEFCEKFWGKSLIDVQKQDLDGNLEFDSIEEWQYHLQQMVLEKEPLKYLERFL